METLVEYYTGRDASQLTDNTLALKVAHIIRIRQLEAEESISKTVNLLYGGK
jgi:hypothetical protein